MKTLSQQKLLVVPLSRGSTIKVRNTTLFNEKWGSDRSTDTAIIFFLSKNIMKQKPEKNVSDA